MDSIHSLDTLSVLPRLLEENKQSENSYRPSSSFVMQPLQTMDLQLKESSSLALSDGEDTSYEDNKAMLNDKLMALLLCHLYGDSFLEADGERKGEAGSELFDSATREQFLELYDMLKNQLPEDLLYSSLQDYLFDEGLDEEESWNEENEEAAEPEEQGEAEQTEAVEPVEPVEPVEQTEQAEQEPAALQMEKTENGDLFDMGDGDLISLFKKIHEMPRREEEKEEEKSESGEKEDENSSRRRIDGCVCCGSSCVDVKAMLQIMQENKDASRKNPK